MDKDHSIEIIKPNLLLVEGKDDVGFFEGLITHLDLNDIQIINVGSTSKYGDRLKAIRNSPNFKKIVISIGIVRDADTNSDAAFQSISGYLRSAKLPVPEKPLKPSKSTPQVTVMILPKEGEPGMLEDLCLSSVVSDSAFPCMEAYFQCLQENGLSLPNKISKAKVQVFLASRQKVGLSLGVAAKAKLWPFDDNAFDQVKTFLQMIKIPEHQLDATDRA